MAACSTRNTPRSINASPTLNTFAPGQPAGTAKTSPRTTHSPRRRSPSWRTSPTAPRARRSRARRPATRHHPAVGGDGDEVQGRPAPPPRRSAGRGSGHAGSGQRVRREVDDPVEGLVALGHDRDDQHLDREGQRHQPDPAQPDLLECAQPSSCRRNGQEEQEEGVRGSMGADGAVTPFRQCGPRPSRRRADLDERSQTHVQPGPPLKPLAAWADGRASRTGGTPVRLTLS